MAQITAAEAHQIIQQEQRALNRAVLPPTLERIRLMMQNDTFRICNVGPWEYRCERASLHVFIPGYDPKFDTAKRGYAASEPLPCIFREAKLIGGGGDTPLEYGWIEDDGHMVALDLIGVGFGMPSRNSLVQYGVFVPAGKEPTTEEVTAAKATLNSYVDRLIAEARDAYDKGPEERKAVISDRHLWAAGQRGIDEKWVHHQHTQESVRCEMCGAYNPAGIAKCKCGSIIDFELFQKLQAQQEAMLDKLTRPTKKA